MRSLVENSLTSFREAGDTALGDFETQVDRIMQEAAQQFDHEFEAAQKSGLETESETKQMIETNAAQVKEVMHKGEEFTEWMRTSGEVAGADTLDQMKKNEAAVQARGLQVAESIRAMDGQENQARSAMMAQIQEARDGSAASLSQAEKDAAAAVAAEVQNVQGKVGEVIGTAGTMEHDFADASRQAENAQNAMTAEMKRAELRTESDFRNLQGRVDNEQSTIERDRLMQEAELDAHELELMRKANLRNSEMTQLGRDVHGEQGAVKSEVLDMMAALQPILNSLDPSGNLAAKATSLEKLKVMLAQAEKTMGMKEGELLTSVTAAARRAAGIQSSVDEEEAALNVEIAKSANKLRDRMRAVHARFAETDSAVAEPTKELANLASDMDAVTKDRFSSVLNDLKNTQGKVDEAAGLEKYQNEEELRKVIEALDASQSQTDKLTAHQTQVLMPNIDTYRRSVEEVMDSMGLSLDYERIARLAAESEASQGESDAILSEEQSLKMEIRSITMDMKKKTDAVWAMANQRIAQIEAMAHLNEEQKEAMIQKIRNEAEKAAAEVMTKARNLLAEKSAVNGEISTAVAELDGLLKRAHQLASSHDGSAQSHALVLRLVAELEAKTQELRERYASSHAAALLEVAPTRAPYRPADVEPLYSKAFSYLESIVPSLPSLK